MPMIFHVHFICALDYNARRLPFRPAHLRQLASLREQRRVVAGGPEPDGTAAHIFYRVESREELEDLLEDNAFNRAGLFTSSHPRAFTDFVEPIEVTPLDAGLAVSLVEGTPGDAGRARAALVELQRRGRVAFGGLVDDGVALAVVRSPNVDQAVEWLSTAGGWEPGRLKARPWSQTL